jgi:hypothetical protein
MGKHKIQISGFSVFRGLIIIDDKKKRRQGHGFPGEHKGKNIGSRYDQGHGSDEDTEEKIIDPCPYRFFFMGHIVETVKGRQKADTENRKKEKSGKSVYFKRQGKNIEIMKGCRSIHGAYQLYRCIKQPQKAARAEKKNGNQPGKSILSRKNKG